MEYYSAFKGQEILTSATTWVKLGAKQNNPVTKGQISQEATYMRYLEQPNSQRQTVE